MGHFYGDLSLKCFKDKELAEANCYPRHSYSKPLLIDAIWFSDRMLFILTTVKNVKNSVWCSKY